MKNYIARDDTPEDDVAYWLFDKKPEKHRIFINRCKYDPGLGQCVPLPEWMVMRLVGRTLKPGECVEVRSKEGKR